MVLWLAGSFGAIALALLGYGWFEAGWLRTRVLDARIEGLPEALDGLRVAHLSDLHFGAPLSRGRLSFSWRGTTNFLAPHLYSACS